jgi:hypothetical protein
LSTGFEKPGVIERRWDGVIGKVELRIARDLPASSSAMDAVAKSELRDAKESKRIGKDDYSSSLKTLLDAFDAFFQEFHNQNVKTGDLTLYDLSNPDEFTICLLWQLRHVSTHHGDLVDSKCKKNYEEIWTKGKGTTPVISLPQTIEIGTRFTIQKENYFAVKNAIFRFIEKKIPNKADLEILRFRSGATNHKITGLTLYHEREGKLVVINADDLVKAGKPARWNGEGFNVDLHVIDWTSRKLIFVSDGTAVPIKIDDPKNRPKDNLIIHGHGPDD